MAFKLIWLKLKQRKRQINKILFWIYIGIMSPWLFFFIILLKNNFSSEIIWKTFIPGLTISCISIGMSFYYGIKNNNKSDEFITGHGQKVIQAFTVGFIGAFFALYASLETEPIETTFPLRLMIHRETGETLEKYNRKYDLFYGSKHIQPRRYLSFQDKPDFKNMQKITYHCIHYPLDVFFLEVLSLGLTSCEETTVNINPVGGGAYRCFPENSLAWPRFPDSVYEQLEPRVQEMCSKLQGEGIFK